MNRLRSFWRVLMSLAVGTLFWLSIHGTVLAKKLVNPLNPNEEPEASWTMGYFLGLMGIALGMLVVCRSSRRRDRAKPEEYTEAKFASRADQLAAEEKAKAEAKAQAEAPKK